MAILRTDTHLLEYFVFNASTVMTNNWTQKAKNQKRPSVFTFCWIPVKMFFGVSEVLKGGWSQLTVFFCSSASARCHLTGAPFWQRPSAAFRATPVNRPFDFLSLCHHILSSTDTNLQHVEAYFSVLLRLNLQSLSDFFPSEKAVILPFLLEHRR